MRDLGIALFMIGRYEEARAHHERHLVLAEELGDRREVANAHGNLGNVAYVSGRLDEAGERWERWLELCREVGARRGEAAATGNLGVLFNDRGRFDRSLEYYETSRDLLVELGDPSSQARLTLNIATLLETLGRYGDSRREAERALELARGAQSTRGQAGARNQLAFLLAWQGDLEGAGRHIAAAADLVGDGEAKDLATSHALVAGLVAERSGRVAEAEPHYARALELQRGLERPARLAECLVDVGRFRLGQGRDEDARTVLREAVQVCEGLEASSVGVLARALLAQLPGEDAAAAETAFREFEDRLGAGDELETRLLLWKSTGADEHLARAHRLLEDRLAAAVDRDAALSDVRLHRDVAAAWEAREAGN